MESRQRWEGDRIPRGLLRLSVGLEDVEELWADLEQALDRASQLSERRSRRRDSNPRPLLYKSVALPAELLRRMPDIVTPRYCRTWRPCWCVRIFRFTRCSALSIVFVSQPSSSAICSYDEPSR